MKQYTEYKLQVCVNGRVEHQTTFLAEENDVISFCLVEPDKEENSVVVMSFSKNVKVEVKE